VSPIRTLAAGLFLATWGVAAAHGATAGEAGADGVHLIDDRTSLRTFVVQGPSLLRGEDGLKVQYRGTMAAFDPASPNARAEKSTRRRVPSFSQLPPVDWAEPDANVAHWPRYLQADLSDFLGAYGAPVADWPWPALLCLRTSFGVADPARATDLKVTVTCLGGGVVYVNGREVGRGFLPKGELHPLTPANDYPIEAYTIEDNATPLPALRQTAQPEPKWRPRYERRVRTFTAGVPSEVLVKGRNVLAVRLHRSALCGPLPRGRGWSHLGFRSLRLTSASGQGVVSFATKAKATRCWNAGPLEPVTETPLPGSLFDRGGRSLGIWKLGFPVRGVQEGGLHEPLGPVRMVVPRNGVCSGQVVLSDPAGLRDVSAELAACVGPDGAAMPPTAAQVRYTSQHNEVQYCDALLPAPPTGAKTLPVRLILQAPKGQRPGWYTSSLHLRANGRKFTAAVQVLVTGATVPDARNFTSLIGLPHSPETLATRYKVEPWSDRHFRLMDQSLAMCGQVGNDVLVAPVILGAYTSTARDWIKLGDETQWRAPMIRWVKSDGGRKVDLSILERYVEAYLKHCAPPRALCLYVWDPACGTEVADAYEGRQAPSVTLTPKAPPTVTVYDPKTGKASPLAAPPFEAKGAEQFWKPMFDAVRDLVRRRGWSERTIMLALGGDIRPGQKTAGLLRKWAPYARWCLLSHFSGDPGSRAYRGPHKDDFAKGRLIATGGLEVGVKQMPWVSYRRPLTSIQLEQRIFQPLEYLEMPTARWHHEKQSPPLTFRTLPLLWGSVSRIGLDFWLARSGGPRNSSFFSAIDSLTVPGPDGPIPTVRFQALREGVQDQEVRAMLIRAYAKLPEDRREPYRALIDEFPRWTARSADSLNQASMAFEWPAYAARLQDALARLRGEAVDARWDRPPE